MHLADGKTIFDKMEVSYDDLRTSPETITRVRRYYRQQALERGKNEMPWWLETPMGMNLRLWSALSTQEKQMLKAQSFILFPIDIFEKKYDNVSLWLCAARSVVNSHIRDMFSAGGQVHYVDKRRLPTPLPRIVKQAVDIAPAVKDYLSKPNDIAYFLDDYNPCLSRGGHRNLFDLWKKQIAMLVESQHKEARMEYWIDHGSVLEIKT